ncbi:MAG: YybH family protein [Gemmatimonadales bacterium]
MRCLVMVSLTAVLAMGCAPREGGMGAGVDTAAARAGIDSTRARYAALLMAGDAAGVAALYEEEATLDVYGVPRTKGRANIQATIGTMYGMGKYTVSEINPINTNVRTNEDASEIGTYHNMRDSTGVVTHEWGRFAVGLHKGADGVWRLTYVMAFPDSTKPGGQ